MKKNSVLFSKCSQAGFISIITALLFLLPSRANAQAPIAMESPTLNRSVRALGMGNAFIAHEGNEHSPFYNPAGLNDLKKGRLKFLSPTAEFSMGGIGLIKDAIDLKNNLNAVSDPDAQIRVLDEFVEANRGDFKYFRGQMDVASYSMKNFACGIIIDERLTFSFRDAAGAKFDAMNTGDATIYLAGAYGFWDKLLQVGVSLKPTVRFAMNDEITYDVVIGSNSASWEDRLTSIYKDYKFGFGADIGLKSNLNFPGLRDNAKYKSFQKVVKPTVAFTWQDIGNPFPETKTTDAGQVIGFVENDQSVNLGFAIHPQFGFLATTFEVDFRRLNQNTSFMNKLHIGGEARFPKILSVRTGFNQGRIAAGLSIDFKYVILDFATYAEESGIYGTRKGDRRIAATINFGV